MHLENQIYSDFSNTLLERSSFMLIIKRNGAEVVFNPSKIYNAVQKASNEVESRFQLSDEQIQSITDQVVTTCENLGHTPNVEEVQNMVEDALMDSGVHEVARAYITYRYDHDSIRQKNPIAEQAMSLIDDQNEEDKQENSNKNPTILSTQRDYMAGSVSKYIMTHELLPPDIVKAHNEGIIHFHDMDYTAQHMHNCDLANLDDMLQNGTVISDVLIEKPHSFYTACNIATQIIAQVSSSQLGGQSITLSHLSPFVDVSRQKIRKELIEEFSNNCIEYNDEQISSITESRLKDEIQRGIQTIQYQVTTIMTTNGQAPFITVFMYLDEVEEGQPRDDLAMVIEEVIRQRYQGVKNEKGVWISPAFPKLVYVLDEDNIHPDSKYYYLTELAAKCTAKRLVPDYVSAKIMRKYKLSKGEEEGHGDVYPPMGCRSFLTPDRSGNGFNNIARAKNYDPDKPKYYGRLTNLC